MRYQNPEPAAELPPEIVQVGRQPILDREQQVYGYELLYRSKDSPPTEGFDGNRATARTVLNSFLDFGIRRLVGSHHVFINMTRAFFTGSQKLPLNKQRLVLECMGDIELDAEVIKGMHSLHERDYTVALDDYRFESRWEAVLPYCNIIKVDITQLDLDAYATHIAALKSRGLLLLAQKVETHDEFTQAFRLGFDFFQGYFFAKPQILSTHHLQDNQLLMLRMFAQINDPECDIEKLSELVMQDINLSFKVLRFVNSAALGLPGEVTSIRQAVVFVGLSRLRAWTSLFAMAQMNNKTSEILTTSLVRAEFIHDLIRATGEGDPDSGYTVGLFSVLDAILDQPMSELVMDMPLSAEIAEALVHRTGTYGDGLNCVLALEHGWDVSFSDILPQDELNALFLDAMVRADEVRHALLD